MKTPRFFAAALLTILAGCAFAPAGHMAIGRQDRTDTPRPVAGCDRHTLAAEISASTPPWPALDGRGFDLLNWNLFKGQRLGWEEDFLAIGGNRQLFTLQEAHLTRRLRDVLRETTMDWDLVPAFTLQGDPAGVLTASAGRHEVLCALRFPEPLIRIPKSMLVTRHRLPGTGSVLILVNVHAVNFTLGIEPFREQWRLLASALSAVDGPLILAGDLNTWSEERTRIVDQTARGLGLRAVVFDPDYRGTIFGRPVDHVYYRGLIEVGAAVHRVRSSDHNPMVVRFRSADDTQIMRPGTRRSSTR